MLLCLSIIFLNNLKAPQSCEHFTFLLQRSSRQLSLPSQNPLFSPTSALVRHLTALEITVQRERSPSSAVLVRGDLARVFCGSERKGPAAHWSWLVGGGA